MPAKKLTGDELLEVLAALANPHRLRVLAALAGGRDYVSHLARELGMSRPLLQMHLKRLESAGLVRSQLELSDDGKALSFFEVVPFSLTLGPDEIVRAVKTLHAPPDAGSPSAREQR